MINIMQLTNILKEDYKSLLLSRKQASKVCGISISTLDRLRANGLGPVYKKIGNSKNATIKYPINEVAKFIINNNHETY